MITKVESLFDEMLIEENYYQYLFFYGDKWHVSTLCFDREFGHYFNTRGEAIKIEEAQEVHRLGTIH